MPRLRKSVRSYVAKNIRPIAEFFPIDPEQKFDSDFIDTNQSDRKELRRILDKSKGIYAFYNSEAEIIYAGKTKGSLWREMKGAYNRRMDHYQRFYVKHPRSRYKRTTSGKVRTIGHHSVRIYDVAWFFSAYSIKDDNLIDVLELILIRMIPNDLINVRMEGNKTLEAAR